MAAHERNRPPVAKTIPITSGRTPSSGSKLRDSGCANDALSTRRAPRPTTAARLEHDDIPSPTRTSRARSAIARSTAAVGRVPRVPRGSRAASKSRRSGVPVGVSRGHHSGHPAIFDPFGLLSSAHNCRVEI
jgi:hypothetical protein